MALVSIIQALRFVHDIAIVESIDGFCTWFSPYGINYKAGAIN